MRKYSGKKFFPCLSRSRQSLRLAVEREHIGHSDLGCSRIRETHQGMKETRRPPAS